MHTVVYYAQLRRSSAVVEHALTWYHYATLRRLSGVVQCSGLVLPRPWFFESKPDESCFHICAFSHRSIIYISSVWGEKLRISAPTSGKGRT